MSRGTRPRGKKRTVRKSPTTTTQVSRHGDTRDLITWRRKQAAKALFGTQIVFRCLDSPVTTTVCAGSSTRMHCCLCAGVHSAGSYQAFYRMTNLAGNFAQCTFDFYVSCEYLAWIQELVRKADPAPLNTCPIPASGNCLEILVSPEPQLFAPFHFPFRKFSLLGNTVKDLFVLLDQMTTALTWKTPTQYISSAANMRIPCTRPASQSARTPRTLFRNLFLAESTVVHLVSSIWRTQQPRSRSQSVEVRAASCFSKQHFRFNSEVIQIVVVASTFF